MKTRTLISRLLTIPADLCVWIPVAAPLLFALLSLTAGQGFRYDYLLPAEVFPLSLIGAALLAAAAWLARQRMLAIIVTVLTAGALFVLMLLAAQWTGLADGTTPMGGWQEWLVMTLLVGFSLAGLALAVFGTRLTVDIWRTAAPA